MQVNERIGKIREAFCQNNNKLFAERLGYSTQYSSNITKTGKNVGEKVLNHILDVFCEVDEAWLKLGKGEMLKTDSISTKEIESNISSEVWNVIKLQAESLARRDNQIDELIKMLKEAQKGVAVDVENAAPRAAQK